MNFAQAVDAIGRILELKRIASAHVVDHGQMSNDELKAGIINVKAQYLDQGTVQSALDEVFYQNSDDDLRVLSRLMIVDVLLNQYDFQSPFRQTEFKVQAIEQSVINRSNEIDIENLACSSRDSSRYRNLELYRFVLEVAWDHEDSKSPDEVNLLRKLRERLGITEADHRFIEAKLGKYPKPSNQSHTKGEVNHARKYLQRKGILFAIQHDDGEDVDVIPEELAVVMRRILGLEIRVDSYCELMAHKPLRKKKHLYDVLDRSGVEYVKADTVEALVGRVIDYIPPSKAIASSSPRYGLTSEQLVTWCKQLGERASGTTEERVQRIITHFDMLRPVDIQVPDERARWYEFYGALATRDSSTLRAQHVIEKDLEMESKFEEATKYLFSDKFNHAPLHQAGTNHPDGLLALGTNFLMWDNKSKETAVNLKDHIKQFDAYMSKADKPVPIFLVIGPSFTPESETEAIRYHAEHFDRNIALITAEELKRLAEEWQSPENKNRESPFPLGMLASTGRFNRTGLGGLF